MYRLMGDYSGQSLFNRFNGRGTWYDGASIKLLDFPSNLDLMDVYGNNDIEFEVGFTDQPESGCYLLIDENWFVILQSNSYSGDPPMKDYGRSTGRYSLDADIDHRHPNASNQ